MSTMRVGGLASGMDIDSIVEKLMVAERIPLDKLEQQKQIYEWQRDAYRDVNKKISTLDTYIADNFILKNLNTKTVTSSNSDLVSAVATSSASGSLMIDEVTKLAKAARGIGNKVDNVTTDTKLSTLFDASNPMPTTITLNAIDKQGKLGKEVSIEIDANTTVGELITKINNSNAGISALFEEVNNKGQLSLTAKNTGKEIDGNNAMATDENGKALFAKLGLSNLVTEAGENAEFKVNGITTERTTNTFSINGYNLTLKAKFSNTVTMTSTTNVDEIIGKVKEFVATYNGFIQDLTGKTKEAKNRDYKPLTTLQKKEMEDDEIKLWEEKAKSGLLRSDSILTNGLSSLRALIYQTNYGVTNQKYNALYTIGIGTSANYSNGGQLEINETKLRKALEEDPDAVVQLLTMSGDKNATVTNLKGETVTADTRGFMRKIRAEMDAIEKKIDERAGRSSMVETSYTLGNNLRNVNQRINSWQDKLKAIETRHWKQFTLMETMISKANSQSASLSGMFG